MSLQIDVFAELPKTPSELNAVVLAAVLKERDRCAKIAEAVQEDFGARGAEGAMAALLFQFVLAIRRGTLPVK